MEKEFDVFKMASFYFICDVEKGLLAQRLDDYEKQLQFEPVWVNIDDAIATNRSLLSSQGQDYPPSTLRDTFVLE